MAVSNGQVANQTTFNNAFLSRNSDSNTTGVIALDNTNPISGASLVNIQREHNANSSFSGMPLNSAKDVKPSWTSTEAGTPTDNMNQRVESLTVISGEQQAAIAGALIWEPLIIKGFADFSAAALENDIELFPLNPKNIIHAIGIKHVTEFLGGSISAYNLEIGLVGALGKYVLPFDVFQAVSDTAFEMVQMFAIESFLIPTSIRVNAIAVGDNLDLATQGSVEIWIQKSLLP